MWLKISYIFYYLRGPAKLCKQIFRESGFRGFFHGLVPTFAREMPGYFFFFGTYELTRSLMTPVGKTKDDIGNYYNSNLPPNSYL